jgi:hypothetical protein
MTLYNKDGTPYQLSKPNPIMKTQDFWEDFVSHNMSWEDETSKDNRVVQPIESNIIIREPSFLEELITTKPEEIKVTEIQPEIKIVETYETDQNQEENSEIKKTFIHCLPAIIKEVKDQLYNENYKRITYDKPTSFEAVIISENDFFLDMWTDVLIPLDSIIYPKTNRKRWWKIQTQTEKENGWIFRSIPSNYHPSFE